MVFLSALENVRLELREEEEWTPMDEKMGQKYVRFNIVAFSQDNQLKLMVQNHRFSQTASKIITLPWSETPPKLGVEIIEESISCYQQLMTAM